MCIKHKLLFISGLLSLLSLLVSSLQKMEEMKIVFPFILPFRSTIQLVTGQTWNVAGTCVSSLKTYYTRSPNFMGVVFFFILVISITHIHLMFRKNYWFVIKKKNIFHSYIETKLFFRTKKYIHSMLHKTSHNALHF